MIAIVYFDPRKINFRRYPGHRTRLQQGVLLTLTNPNWMF
jgi:hypothetical protein